MSDVSPDSQKRVAGAASASSGPALGSSGEGEIREEALDPVVGGVQLPDVRPPHTDPPVYIV